MKRSRAIANQRDLSPTPFSSKKNKRSFLLAVSISSILVLLMALTVLILFVPSPWGITSAISIVVWVIGIYFVFVEFLTQQNRHEQNVRDAANKLSRIAVGEFVDQESESITPAWKRLDRAIYRSQFDAYHRLFSSTLLSKKAFLAGLRPCVQFSPYPQGALVLFRCEKGDIDKLNEYISKAFPVCLKGRMNNGVAAFIPMASYEQEWISKVMLFLKRCSFGVSAVMSFLSVFDEEDIDAVLFAKRSKEQLTIIKAHPRERVVNDSLIAFEEGAVRIKPAIEVLLGKEGEYSEIELENLCNLICKSRKFYVFDSKFCPEVKKSKGSFFAKAVMDEKGICIGFVYLYHEKSVFLGIEKEKEIELHLLRLQEKYFKAAQITPQISIDSFQIADYPDYDSLPDDAESQALSYEPKKKPLDVAA